MKTYSDDDLLNPDFPDPRRSDAGPLIDQYFENKGAAMLDQAIQQTTQQQRTDQAKQATNEARAAGWFTRLFKHANR